LARIDESLAVHDALDAAPEHCREVLDRFFCQDESYATIGSALDLPAGVVAVLGRLGVEVVFVSDRDTYTDGDLFSFRRSQRTGRFAGVVRASG
jgi:copper oxidase (laccase) domain-containing protein